MYLFSQNSVSNVCAVLAHFYKKKINKNTQLSLQNKTQQHKDKQELYSRIFLLLLPWSVTRSINQLYLFLRDGLVWDDVFYFNNFHLKIKFLSCHFHMRDVLPILLKCLDSHVISVRLVIILFQSWEIRK